MYISRLWNILSNISSDPIGIQYQWRESDIERLYHQALDIHERFRVCFDQLITNNIIINSRIQLFL